MSWAKAFQQAYVVGSEGEVACSDFVAKKSVHLSAAEEGDDEEDNEFGSAFGQSKELAQFMNTLTKKRKDGKIEEQSDGGNKKQKAEILEHSENSEKPKKKKKHKKDKRRHDREN